MDSTSDKSDSPNFRRGSDMGDHPWKGNDDTRVNFKKTCISTCFRPEIIRVMLPNNE